VRAQFADAKVVTPQAAKDAQVARTFANMVKPQEP
jgi:hypothetical protein